MKKHGSNCDCGMCRMGKAIGMIKKPQNDQDQEHDQDQEQKNN